MKTDDHPRRLFAIDGGEIILEPLVLLVRVSKGTVVCTGVRAPGFVWRLKTNREVSFGIENDEVGEAVVKGVPEIAEATRFFRRHVEVVDCGMERDSSTGRENEDGLDSLYPVKFVWPGIHMEVV